MHKFFKTIPLTKTTASNLVSSINMGWNVDLWSSPCFLYIYIYIYALLSFVYSMIHHIPEVTFLVTLGVHSFLLNLWSKSGFFLDYLNNFSTCACGCHRCTSFSLLSPKLALSSIKMAKIWSVLFCFHVSLSSKAPISVFI